MIGKPNAAKLTNSTQASGTAPAVAWSAWFGVMVEWVKWWGWKRWRIYCPKGAVSHLFERPDFERSLFDYDEAFVSPCTLNEMNCGGSRGNRTPKIALIGLEPDDRMKDE